MQNKVAMGAAGNIFILYLYTKLLKRRTRKVAKSMPIKKEKH